MGVRIKKSFHNVMSIVPKYRWVCYSIKKKGAEYLVGASVVVVGTNFCIGHINHTVGCSEDALTCNKWKSHESGSLDLARKNSIFFPQ